MLKWSMYTQWRTMQFRDDSHSPCHHNSMGFGQPGGRLRQNSPRSFHTSSWMVRTPCPAARNVDRKAKSWGCWPEAVRSGLKVRPERWDKLPSCPPQSGHGERAGPGLRHADRHRKNHSPTASCPADLKGAWKHAWIAGTANNYSANSS